MIKLGRIWSIAFLLLLLTFSACKDDEPIDIMGVVSFAKESLQEIEGASAPLSINIGIENAGHMGGSIDVEIIGGNWAVDYETNTDSSVFTLDIGANALSSSFTILPIDDEAIEEDLELTIQLTGASGNLKLGSKTSMTFTILDNDEPTISMISFVEAGYDLAEEASSPVVVPITFDKASTEGGTITVETSGSAVLGTDYTLEGISTEMFTLTVAPGDTSASISVSAIDNGDFEENKDILFVLKEVTGGLKLFSRDSTTVIIINDDTPTIPVVDFGNGIADSLLEDAGTVSIPLVLSSPLAAAATIEVHLDAASTTTIGDDFLMGGASTSPLILQLSAGAMDATLELIITDDMDFDPNESIVLELRNPTGDLNLGVTNTKITIIIKDNDLNFVPFNYLETFESFNGRYTFLDSALSYKTHLTGQTIDSTKTLLLINASGAFADEMDPTMSSDNGLNLFYNSNRDMALFGELDNVLITPQMPGYGTVDVNLDAAYAFKNNNNAIITYYWSDTYNGTDAFDPMNWNVMGIATADSMNTLGYGNNAYKREAFTIEPSAEFYVAIRIKQTIDNTYFRLRWRFDNIRAKTR